MVRKVLTAVGALLGVFHAGLFVSQLVDGRLADFTTISQWLFAFVLLGALLHLRRQRASLVRGRQATVVWLLAAMLHAPSVAERIAPVSEWAAVDVAAVVVQVATAVGLIASFLLAVLAFGRRRDRPVAQRAQVPAVHRASPISDAILLFAPRPPPISQTA